MADTHAVGFRPHLASHFEAVAALWTRVDRELAPAGAPFEQYIATTIKEELSHLLDIFALARRNALGWRNTHSSPLRSRATGLFRPPKPFPL